MMDGGDTLVPELQADKSVGPTTPAGLKRLGQLAFSIIHKDLKGPEFRTLFSPRITGEIILPKGRGGYWPGGRPDTLVGPGAGDRSVPATLLMGLRARDSNLRAKAASAAERSVPGAIAWDRRRW